MKVTLLKILDNKTGEGKNGTWTNVQFLAKTDAQYDPDVAFKCRGDVAKEILATPIGTDIEIMYNLKSREYNGKWYTDCEVWKFVVLNLSDRAQESAPITPNPKADVPARATESAGDESDLPF